MAEENRLRGAERIRGELFKLGLKIAKRTIQKYLPKDRHPPGITIPRAHIKRFDRKFQPNSMMMMQALWKREKGKPCSCS